MYRPKQEELEKEGSHNHKKQDDVAKNSKVGLDVNFVV